MESGFQKGLVSSAGARGVMRAAEHARVRRVSADRRKVPSSTSGNIRIGVVFLRHLLREFHGNGRALAAWYQGPHSLRKHGQFAGTRLFVRNVLALLNRALAAATGCGGGFESTSTAAASRIAIPTALSPSRLRGRPARAARRAPARAHEEVVRRAPHQRERDEPELHQQHLAVALVQRSATCGSRSTLR